MLESELSVYDMSPELPFLWPSQPGAWRHPGPGVRTALALAAAASGGPCMIFWQ